MSTTNLATPHIRVTAKWNLTWTCHRRLRWPGELSTCVRENPIRNVCADTLYTLISHHKLRGQNISTHPGVSYGKKGFAWCSLGNVDSPLTNIWTRNNLQQWWLTKKMKADNESNSTVAMVAQPRPTSSTRKGCTHAGLHGYPEYWANVRVLTRPKAAHNRVHRSCLWWQHTEVLNSGIFWTSTVKNWSASIISASNQSQISATTTMTELLS